MEKKERFKQAELVAKIGIAGNLLLAVFKLIFGYFANSRALIADGVNSASDVAASIVVFVGLKAAKRPPDKEHPYGHGKAESIAAIIVAVLLAIVGFEIGKTSFLAFFQPVQAPKFFAIIVIVVAILIKEGMFQYTFRMGKKLNSDALIVTAYDHRSDVYSSLAALIGIGASIIGDNIGIYWLIFADPIAGVVVSILIIKMAYQLGKEAIYNTLDQVLEEDETLSFRNRIEQIPEVKHIDELHARVHGHYVIIDIKIAVDPNLTVEEGHRIGKMVKETLMEDKRVENVFVHINPYHLDSY